MGEVIPLARRRRTTPGAPPGPGVAGRPGPASRPGPGELADSVGTGGPLWREVLGRRLRELRRRRGERLADVAARARISPQYLSELERGRKDPSSEILAALAAALGVPLRDVVRLAQADLPRAAPSPGPVLRAG